MVSRLFSGDWEGFLVNAVHPPLGKLMIGVFTSLMGSIVGVYESTVLLMCILSSFTSLLVYKIASELFGEKGGIIAWAAYSFDPFSIHWTVAWLDTPTLLFITLSQYLLLKFKSGERYPFFLISTFFYGLALMTKFHAILFIPSVLVFLKEWRKRIMFLTTFLAVFTINPQLWIPNGLQTIIRENILVTGMSFQHVKFSPMLFLVILVEFFYRVAVGYVGEGVSPYFIPLFTFILLIWKKKLFDGLKHDLIIDWIFWSLVGILLTPRILYPEYYYIYTIPPLSAFLASFTSDLGKNKSFRWFLVLIFLYSSLLTFVSWFINASCWKALLLETLNIL